MTDFKPSMEYKTYQFCMHKIINNAVKSYIKNYQCCEFDGYYILFLTNSKNLYETQLSYDDYSVYENSPIKTPEIVKYLNNFRPHPIYHNLNLYNIGDSYYYIMLSEAEFKQHRNLIMKGVGKYINRIFHVKHRREFELI